MFGLVTNLVVSALLVLGGSAVITAVTGLSVLRCLSLDLRYVHHEHHDRSSCRLLPKNPVLCDICAGMNVFAASMLIPLSVLLVS